MNWCDTEVDTTMVDTIREMFSATVYLNMGFFCIMAGGVEWHWHPSSTLGEVGTIMKSEGMPWADADELEILQAVAEGILRKHVRGLTK